MECNLCQKQIESEFFRWGVGQYQQDLFCDQLNPETHLDICPKCNQRFPVGALGPEWHWQALDATQTPKPPPLGKSGEVYLIADGRAVKIGNSRSVNKRLKELQTGNSHPLKVLATQKSDDCERLEGYLHGMFAEQHCLGEWYELDDGHIATATSVLERNAVSQPDALAGLDYLRRLASVYFQGLGVGSSVVIPWEVVSNRCEVTL
ncbi:GIY-YIG nuclease family protein [Leptothoe sp. ISB3NOV94-8A]